MAKVLQSRVALQALALALILLLLSAGAALARSTEDAKAEGGGKARLGHARAVNGLKCVAGRSKRVRLVRSRGRCVRKPAAVSTAAPSPIYWGATIGDHITGTQAPWDMSSVSRFESSVGKAVSMINFFQPFANCPSGNCSFYKFPSGPMDLIRGHGSIPVFTWASQSTPSSLNEPDFQLSDVISGRYDEYLRGFAEESRDWGHPYFLRFNWEMNGDWFPWSEEVNGNQPGEYVAAWRHVHDIFTAVGATNATWVWCPNVDPAGSMQDLAPLYPGDEYVDWTGLDGYNWGTNPASPKGWKSWDGLFRDTYDEITGQIAPSKPMMIGETGATEIGGSKAAWIKDALGRIPTEYPSIRALLWFDKFDDGMDWPIETSSSATAAFAEGIQHSSYLGNSYGSLGSGTVPVPG
jgi:hypothetical protein